MLQIFFPPRKVVNLPGQLNFTNCDEKLNCGAYFLNFDIVVQIKWNKTDIFKLYLLDNSPKKINSIIIIDKVQTSINEIIWVTINYVQIIMNNNNWDNAISENF